MNFFFNKHMKKKPVTVKCPVCDLLMKKTKDYIFVEKTRMKFRCPDCKSFFCEEVRTDDSNRSIPERDGENTENHKR